MITYSEIETESIRLGVSPETIEKDDHLDWYLTVLWAEPLFPHGIFYGGTAIKKLYAPHHRFSEDIDLISDKRLPPETISANFDRARRLYKERWETRLKKQIAELPEMSVVIKTIELKLKELFENHHD